MIHSDIINAEMNEIYELNTFIIAYLLNYPKDIGYINIYELKIEQEVFDLLKYIDNEKEERVEKYPIEILTDYINISEDKYFILYEDIKYKYNDIKNKPANEMFALFKKRCDRYHFLYKKNSILTSLIFLEHQLKISKTPDEAQDVLSEIRDLDIDHKVKVITDIEAEVKHIFTEVTTIKTGVEEIDNIDGFTPGNIISIMGDSGNQKTMFSLWWILHMLKINPNIKAMYFEKEMPKRDIAKRIFSYFTKKEAKNLYQNKEEYLEEWDKLKNMNEDVLNRFALIGPNQFDNSYDIRYFVKKYNANIWVLDFLTMLSPPSYYTKGTINDFFEEEIKNLKRIAQETQSVGIILSQLKQSQSVLKSSNKIPTIEDMEYGKKLRQLSSYIFSIFYPYSYFKDVEKLRWFYLVPRKIREGQITYIPFTSYPEYCTYEIPENKYLLIDYITEYNK